MLLLTIRHRRTAFLRLALVATACLTTACGGSDANTPRTRADASGEDASQDDAAIYNPPNPAGLGPAPVDLGVPGDLAAPISYVLLSKTGITNVTGSSITGGNIGVSPAAASFITGFALKKDASGKFATSIAVIAPGKVYASNYTNPTPANLTAAILGIESAYTDAAARTTPNGTNIGGGNIGEQTLEPGLYVWGSSVTIPKDLTLAGGPDDVWVLQVSGDVDLSAAKKVTLTGGAKAKNVFWQVAGQLTIHADAHFEGIVLCQTGVTLQTNATMTGRILAQTLIALDDNAVTAP